MTRGEMTSEQNAYLQDWARRMMFTASDEVMIKMQAMQEASVKGNYMVAGTQLFLAMRRDMGNANTRISPRQMLRAIVKVADWDQVDEMIAGRWKPRIAASTLPHDPAGHDVPALTTGEAQPRHPGHGTSRRRHGKH
jgi:hypothetical protein